MLCLRLSCRLLASLPSSGPRLLLSAAHSSTGLPPQRTFAGRKAVPSIKASSVSLLSLALASADSAVSSRLEKRQRLMTTAVTSAAAAAAETGPLAAAASGGGGGEGKEASGRRVGTHNGTFHCDEALGCFILRLTDKFRNAEIIRTRNQQILDGLDAVLDVGGVYDASKDRFDHHQREFSDVFGYGFKTKLSSAGLVYKHYGREVIAEMMKLPIDHKDVETVYLAVYKNFIEAVDAIDNGVNQFPTDSPPLYQNNTHLAARIGRLNPDWLEAHTEENENAHFQKAMALAGSELLESINYTAKSWLPGRSIVAQSIANAKGIYPTGEIVVLTQFCPWKQHLADLELDLGIPSEELPKYVIYQDDRGSQWRLQAVSVTPGSFQSRLPLPAKWRGLRDEELSSVSGIPGCVFVHSSGFIGGNQTKEGVLEMAKRALQSQCSEAR